MRYRTQNASCGCLIAALVFCILGVVFLAVAQGDLRDYLASANWETASGEVLSSDLDISSDSDGTSYRARITYRYFVGDHPYTSDRVKFGDDIYGGRGGAEEMVSQYPPGKQIEVLYNPADPEDAVVERELGGGLLVFGGLGAIFLLITPLMLLGVVISPVLRLLRG